MPLEQSRWNQANIDSLFYAGAQNFINNHFGFTQNNSLTKYYFNLLQQPVNMVTGYQRQHRKSMTYLPTEGSDPQTTDQYTKLITHVCSKGAIYEQFSRACEQSCIQGLSLLQPYLDFANSDDHAQGEMKVKVWEYNSFLVDPYAREPDFSDANFIWFQEYISKKEAEDRFPDKVMQITPMAGTPQRYGSFYFLPENYNMARNDLMVLSYVWYKWRRKKKRLYSRTRNQFFDFAGGQENMDALLYNIPDLEEVTVEVPTWKLAVVLNDQLMFHGDNPLSYDSCPIVPVYWNYEPHLNQYDLRCRGLVRTMRDSNYLMNRQILISHDQKEATINAGYIRKVGAVANEDNLKRTGQGWDVIINEGYEMTDFQKIQPNSVPESDFALADRLRTLIFGTSGVDLENWSAQNDKQASSLTTMLKQAANLMVLQKYFDQWDYALKLLGDKMLQIALNNWNAEKVQMLVGEEPTPHFYSRMFAKYQVIVEEGIMTATQQNMQAQALMDINSAFGREVFPPSMIIKNLSIQGKAEAMQFLQQQEQMAQAQQEQASHVQHMVEDAKVKELYSKAAANIATAKERHGRAQADVGLYEERLSEITRNRALATKDKMEALEKMVDVTAKLGAIETMVSLGQIERFNDAQAIGEDIEKRDADRTSAGHQFMMEILKDIPGLQQPQQPQGQQQAM